MRIGIAKEIKRHEYRVGATPHCVSAYKAAGHEVLIETGAGLSEQRRTLIGIGGLVVGIFTVAAGLTIAHLTNLPTEDALGNEILPSIPRGCR